jgi:hypothetical protein
MASLATVDRDKLGGSATDVVRSGITDEAAGVHWGARRGGDVAGGGERAAASSAGFCNE